MQKTKLVLNIELLNICLAVAKLWPYHNIAVNVLVQAVDDGQSGVYICVVVSETHIN